MQTSVSNSYDSYSDRDARDVKPQMRRHVKWNYHRRHKCNARRERRA